MALVTDNKTADIAYTPYQRPPDSIALRTAIPRGLKSFVVRGAVLAAKPVNDTELLVISWTLPGGFGYVLNELHLNIVVDVADDWNNRGHLRMSQTSIANRDFDYRIPIDFLSFSQNGTTTGVRSSKVQSGTLTRVPIVPRSTGSTAQLSFTNTNAAVGAAGTVDAVISFFEYDLEQIAWFPAHIAAAVITR